MNPMDCPHCASPNTVLLPKATSLGYLRFSCQHCSRTFNERTHETVRDWEVRFGPLLAEHLRRKRHRRAGRAWYVYETYLAVKGKWVYVYRAIDSDGQLVDALLSEHRDMPAAKAFFESAKSVVGWKPKQVFTDGHTPNPRAIEETLGKRVEHRVIPCLASPVEQDHRGIKQRYYPTLGFKAFGTAADFCRASEEVRNYFRPRKKMGEAISLSDRRRHFIGRYLKLQDQFCVAA